MLQKVNLWLLREPLELVDRQADRADVSSSGPDPDSLLRELRLGGLVMHQTFRAELHEGKETELVLDDLSAEHECISTLLGENTSCKKSLKAVIDDVGHAEPPKIIQCPRSPMAGRHDASKRN